ncbi:hypothetical protein ACP70R_031286 [Stipagrostis hirtigluma subsp. patula]
MARKARASGSGRKKKGLRVGGGSNKKGFRVGGGSKKKGLRVKASCPREPSGAAAASGGKSHRVCEGAVDLALSFARTPQVRKMMGVVNADGSVDDVFVPGVPVAASANSFQPLAGLDDDDA